MPEEGGNALVYPRICYTDVTGLSCNALEAHHRPSRRWDNHVHQLPTATATVVRGQTWPRPFLHWWGIPPTRLNLSLGRHLRRAMLPKFSTYKIRIWAIMLKHFRISRPNGGLDRHFAQGY